MGGSGEDRPHFAELDLKAAAGELPGRFRTRQTGADDANDIHWRLVIDE
jgi:hypothetical protein